jgi:hypothetical protein
MRDLVVLVPDKNTESTVRGALERHQAMGIRQIDFRILVEQGRDGGVRRRRQLDNRLSASWGNCAKAIVVQSELDVWMWGAETHLRASMSWDFQEGIRSWLETQAFRFDENGKPARPKEALETAFRRAKVPRSSARYEYIAQRISLANCTDPAFLRLRTTLVGWFALG